MEILVKLEHFLDYQKKNHTTYLDKKNKYRIWSKSKTKLLEKIDINSINEMLDGIKTFYEMFKDDKNNYKILFKTKGNDYRFDLQFEQPIIYHLMFSDDDFKDGEYEKLTNKNESSEVFGKLSYILQDFNKINNNNIEYCIGATGNEKKDRLYNYFMNYTKKWEKRETDMYELGWALYFKI